MIVRFGCPHSSGRHQFLCHLGKRFSGKEHLLRWCCVISRAVVRVAVGNNDIAHKYILCYHLSWKSFERCKTQSQRSWQPNQRELTVAACSADHLDRPPLLSCQTLFSSTPSMWLTFGREIISLMKIFSFRLKILFCKISAWIRVLQPNIPWFFRTSFSICVNLSKESKPVIPRNLQQTGTGTRRRLYGKLYVPILFCFPSTNSDLYAAFLKPK